MSLDLVVLTSGSAPDYDRALRVYGEEEAGEPDARAIDAFADALDRTFGEANWPFAGDPIVTPAYVLLTVAHEAWKEVVPRIVESAHAHRLVVLDPQSEELFPPGRPYDLDAGDESADDSSRGLRVEMTVHLTDGTSEDVVVYDTSRWWRRGPGRILSWIHLVRLNVRRGHR